jgi:REP-associated tyrosine transposase
MASKRTSHAVYETKYHLVWAPKYGKGMLRGPLRERVEGLLREIAQDFGFAIDT